HFSSNYSHKMNSKLQQQFTQYEKLAMYNHIKRQKQQQHECDKSHNIPPKCKIGDKFG
ncbi:hypothetical protein HDU92_004628, partial [Lobulomyces angularis]